MGRIGFLLIFLVLNFGGLALGNWLMNNGPVSEWYLNLNQAPWTPPGWLFGLAWTLIMICFSIYLAVAASLRLKGLYGLYAIALVLNISWNYLFFNLHLTGAGLINIVLLTVILFIFYIRFKESRLRSYRLLLLPYLIWLLLATSLNAYIVIYN